MNFTTPERTSSIYGYGPFGMITVGRSWVAGSEYRYGFNGTETERDFVANQITLDFGERFYNPQIGRLFSMDKLATLIPSYSAYSFALNSPILVIDVLGMYPYVIHVRSFAPFDLFAFSCWTGDGYSRGFTTSSYATSRCHQITDFDTESFTPTSTGITTTSLSCYGVEANSEVYVDQKFRTNSNGGIIKTHLYGNDDAIIPYADGTPIEDIQSPNIDVYSQFQVSTGMLENGASFLRVRGNMKGDAFPAAEAYMSDAAGNSIFLGVSPARYGPDDGPFIALWGDNHRMMAQYDVLIATDNNGNFLGIIQVDGTIMPVGEWNKQFIATNTVSVPPANQFKNKKKEIPSVEPPGAGEIYDSKDFTSDGKIIDN